MNSEYPLQVHPKIPSVSFRWSKVQWKEFISRFVLDLLGAYNDLIRKLSPPSDRC